MHDRLAEDATTVIAILYDRWTTPTLNQDLAAALDWDLDRLLAAYDETHCVWSQPGCASHAATVK